MILTVTLNPSVDTLYKLDTLNIDSVNRTAPLKVLGGKGVNAARVLSILGSQAIVTGFLGGYNGQYFSDNLNVLLKNNPMKNEFIKCHDETRNCITIMHDSGKQTEINELGPRISNNELNQLLSKIKIIINTHSINIVVISGNIPIGVDEDIYYQLISLINSLNPDTKVILDTSQDVLKKTLKLCNENCTFPYAIKPNIHELKEISPIASNDIAKLISACSMDNIPIVIVSMGSKGCFAKIKSSIYSATVKPITAVNPTGSGDSSVGALAYAIENNLSDKNLIQCSMAAGEANALEENIGYISKNKYQEYYNYVKVKKIV